MPAQSNILGARYPAFLPDNAAIFKVNLPAARTVQLDLDGLHDLHKDADGLWTLTTKPLSPGFHYYSLRVDGTTTTDPNSKTYYGCSREMSGLEVPYQDERLRWLFNRHDVERGVVSERWYWSNTSARYKRMFVYTPPRYDGRAPLPVMYLMHGGGENEQGWPQQGRTGILADNLLASGEMQPMIIAMVDGNTKHFDRELLTEMIPFVEGNYNTYTDAPHRALAGLSMGGIQTLDEAVMHPELFAYLGVFSSGWFAEPPAFAKGGDFDEDLFAVDKYYKLLAADPRRYNDAFRVLCLTMGGPEDIAYDNNRLMRARFDQMGIRYTYSETPGGHTWPVWRISLTQFLPQLFRHELDTGPLREEATQDVQLSQYFTPAKPGPLATTTDGFIRRWMLLEPISKPNTTNTPFTDSYLRQALDTTFYRGQETFPADGQSVKVGREKPQWHALDSRLFNVKLYRLATGLGKQRYGVVFLATTHIDVTEEAQVRLSVGSNSGSLWWVDGKEALILSADRRMVADDAASKPIKLTPGRHTIRGAIINGPGMSDFCVRLLDDNLKPWTHFTTSVK